MDKFDMFISELKGTYSEYIFDKIINNLTSRKDIEGMWYSLDLKTQDEIKESGLLIIEQAIDKAYLNVTEEPPITHNTVSELPYVMWLVGTVIVEGQTEESIGEKAYLFQCMNCKRIRLVNDIHLKRCKYCGRSD